MIPTRYRAKLPRELSHPVGAATISEALSGAPHCDAFSLSFYAGGEWRASEFRLVLAEGRPYKIFEARYQPSRAPGFRGSERKLHAGWYDPTWLLHVYAVPSECRHAVGESLRNDGLPRIVEWLESSGRTGWLNTWQKIELQFDPVARSITSQIQSGV